MKKLIRIVSIIATLVLLVAVTVVPSASANTLGIRVTVRDSNRNPIPSALVQFVRSMSPASQEVCTYRSDMMGVAMFPNASAGTYGINVTHPDFASTSGTSLQITLGVNELRQVTITMAQPNYPFLRLNWAPILENMGTISNPTYRISSVYGWREWANNPLHLHHGIDIIASAGQSLGRVVNTPFAGEVVHVYTNTGSAGFGIVIRYFEFSLQSDFYVRHLHLQALPARANGTLLNANNVVTRGEQVGRLGATGSGGGAHLHIDVHRDANPRNGAIWASTIDPRAFFVHGFVAPWLGMNILN
jgi:murein DD-endopeptidase MepM/ murein hydrolase activator NlpD